MLVLYFRHYLFCIHVVILTLTDYPTFGLKMVNYVGWIDGEYCKKE